MHNSGDLSRMLPAEMHLMAAGWPRKSAVPMQLQTGPQQQPQDEPQEELQSGNRAARLLHMVRRAERMLMSYERTGVWVAVCGDGVGVRGRRGLEVTVTLLPAPALYPSGCLLTL